MSDNITEKFVNQSPEESTEQAAEQQVKQAQQEADEITIEQGFLSICNLAYEQWEKQKESIGQLHYSNMDALGDVRHAYLNSEYLLRNTWIHGRKCLTNETPDFAAKLQPALVELATQAIKAAISLTDIRDAAKKLDHKARIAAIVSEHMANLPVDEQEH